MNKRNVVLETLTVEYVPIGGIKPNAYNPNRQSEHDFDLLCRSMEEDGFTQPVVAVRINEEHRADDKFAHYEVDDVVIVDGEHRWRAADKLGLPAIPVVMVPMNVEQMRIATLRHNRARGSEDMQLAADVLRDLQALGALDWAADSLMYDDVELNRILDDLPAPDALAHAEFSEGWRPGFNSDVHEQEHEGGGFSGMRVSHTPAAIEQQRETERKLAEAKDEDERAIIRRDNAVYRVTVTFAGDEAAVVKAVLGDAPATNLLALCREKMADAEAA
jgi:hypothetical protein